MGYWTCRSSDDGGKTWSGSALPLVDFDHLPEIPGDEWSGSFHGVALSNDEKSLHIALVRWDERDQVNPLYGRSVGLLNRYDLYYLRLDLPSGQLYNVNGERIDRPLNRRDAKSKCLVWEYRELFDERALHPYR